MRKGKKRSIIIHTIVNDCRHIHAHTVGVIYSYPYRWVSLGHPTTLHQFIQVEPKPRTNSHSQDRLAHLIDVTFELVNNHCTYTAHILTAINTIDNRSSIHIPISFLIHIHIYIHFEHVESECGARQRHRSLVSHRGCSNGVALVECDRLECEFGVTGSQ